MGLRTWIIAALLAAAFPLAAIASDAHIGHVKSAEGAVFVDRDGSEIAATPGTQLLQGDVVRTGEDGVVGMSFTDNSRMSLGPSSELSLEKYLYSKQQKAFDARLQRGSMTATSGQIAKKPMAMRILIPTGILGVRGTHFAVRAGG